MLKTRIAGIAAAVVLIGAGTVAYAAIPDSAGVVHGCYNKGGLLQDKGALRVVDSGERCRGNETAMTWSQTGPQGPAGPVGAAGAKGDTGPAGFSDSYQDSNGLDLRGETTVAELSLPAGAYAVFGKADLNNQEVGLRSVVCSLNGTASADSTLPPRGESERRSVSVQDQIVLTEPGTVTMSCDSRAAYAMNVKLTALKVGQVHYQ
jgi:hypothetical protein